MFILWTWLNRDQVNNRFGRHKIHMLRNWTQIISMKHSSNINTGHSKADECASLDLMRFDSAGLAEKFASVRFVNAYFTISIMFLCKCTFATVIMFFSSFYFVQERNGVMSCILFLVSKQFRENVIKFMLVIYMHKNFESISNGCALMLWMCRQADILLDITIILPVHGVQCARCNLKFILKLKSPTKLQ